MNYEYMVLYDGHDVDNEIDAHQQILNSYGAKGWDLVHVAHPVATLCGPTSFVYFFKRTLADGAQRNVESTARVVEGAETSIHEVAAAV